MKRFKGTIFLLIFIPSALGASNIDFKTRRSIKIEVLRLYEGYVNAMQRLHSVSYDYLLEDDFLNLFDEDAHIYNSAIPTYVPGEDLLSPKEYVERYKAINSAGFGFDGFRCDSIKVYDDTFYKASCEFNHIVKYFKTDIYYPDYKFTCRMEILIPQEDVSKAKIKQITVSEPLGDYWVLQNPDSLVFSDEEGYPYVFTRYGRIFERDKGKSPDYFCRNEDDIFSPLTMLQNENNPRFYTASRKDKNKVDFGIAYSPLTIGNSVSRVEGLDGVKNYSSGLSLYGMYGIQIKHNKKGYWFVNLGLQASLYNSRYYGSNYTEYDAIDVDGDAYLRKISLDVRREVSNVLSLSVPVTIECVIPVREHKDRFLSVEFGGYIGVNALSKTRFNVDASYRGWYDFFGGVEFDHYYDYGDFELSNKNTTMNYIPQINRLNGGAILGVSYMQKFGSKDDWLWKAGFMYKAGFTTNYKQNQGFVLSPNKEVYNPIVQVANCPSQVLNLTLSLVKLF